MRIKKLIAAVALLGLTPLATAQSDGYDKAAKKNYAAGKKAYAQRTLTDVERERVAVEFEEMLAGKAPDISWECEEAACAEGCTEKCQAYTAKMKAKVAENPSAFYAEKLGMDAAAWQVLGELTRKRYGADETSGPQKALILDLVAHAPYETSAEIASSLWSDDRESFDQEHVLAFAARGGKVFKAELAERAQACNEAYGEADIRPAAFLAFHGDDVGAKALVRAVKNADYEADSIAQPMVAALALEDLGKKGVYEKVRIQVMEATLAALDAGDVKRAKGLAMQAEFFHELTSTAEGKWKLTDLAWLDEKLHFHCEASADALASADDVFALIERVSPM